MQHIDEQISIWISSLRFEVLDYIALLLAKLGEPLVYSGIGFLLLVYAFIEKKYTVVLFYMTIMCLGFVLVFGTKHLVDRPRPYEVLDKQVRHTLVSDKEKEEESHQSFPSGHAAFSTMLVLFLNFYKPKYKVAYLTYILLMMWSRVYLQMHFLTDVVVGVLLGYSIVKSVSLLFQKYVKEMQKTVIVNEYNRK